MVIRMRHTRAHTRNRRSHHALKGERLSTDKKTGAQHPRHMALLDGTPYRGRSVMDKNAKSKAAPKTAPRNEGKTPTQPEKKKGNKEEKK